MSKYALVQLDDYDTTHSTGGVVIFVSEIEMECKGHAFKELKVEGQDELLNENLDKKVLPCPDETQVGWIYKDKEHIFIDSNYSTNG